MSQQTAGKPFQGQDAFGSIVTPEAVVLEFDNAGLGSRTIGAFLDLLILNFLGLAMTFAYLSLDGLVTAMPSWVGVAVMIFGLSFLTLGYPMLFETFWGGRTPGKAALGLRVVTVEGSPIHFRHAMIRSALGIVEIFMTMGALGALVMLFTKRSQRLGDLVAGTVVLRERAAAGPPVSTAFSPPPEAEDFTSTLDVTGLSNEEYLMVRTYLTRALSMQLPARSSLSEQLGRRIAQSLHVAPPPWMTAETFLVCVASAYQRRFASSQERTK